MIDDAVWAEDERTEHRLDPPGARRVRRHDGGRARSPRPRRASRSAPPSCRCSRAIRSRWSSSRCRRNSSPTGRFTLGLGPSHHWIIEDMLGLAVRASRRARPPTTSTCSTRRWTVPAPVDVENEQLHDPQPDVRHRRAAHAGDARRARAGDAASSPASRTDGTILWLADEKAIESHIAPRINAAATEAGRPAPRIVAGVPICLCLPERGRCGQGPRRPGAQRGDRVAQLPAPARPGRRDRRVRHPRRRRRGR